jgi:hypothetical protein
MNHQEAAITTLDLCDDDTDLKAAEARVRQLETALREIDSQTCGAIQGYGEARRIVRDALAATSEEGKT